MRQSILALYWSANALRFDGDWVDRLRTLPKRGLFVWGAKDPYVPLSVACRFAKRHAAELHIERYAGHWAIVERAQEISKVLLAHWQK
jgi:pimeloyl-ACP methyl ester carboxylesterase